MSAADKAQNFLSQFDKEVRLARSRSRGALPSSSSLTRIQLSKYPALNNIEKQTGVPKVYSIGGLGFLYIFLIFLNFGGQFLTNLAGFLIPAYYSMNALLTTTKADDTQWLTYV